MDKEEILYKVEDVVVDLLAIDRAIIKPETKLYEDLDFEHFFIQPMDGKDQKEAIKKSEKFVMKHPLWKLSLQTHKIMGIP